VESYGFGLGADGVGWLGWWEGVSRALGLGQKQSRNHLGSLIYHEPSSRSVEENLNYQALARWRRVRPLPRVMWQAGKGPPMPRLLLSRERGRVFNISDTQHTSDVVSANYLQLESLLNQKTIGERKRWSRMLRPPSSHHRRPAPHCRRPPSSTQTPLTKPHSSPHKTQRTRRGRMVEH
jgi:hypothetical protein